VSNSRWDVAVIGAGAFGAWTALCLRNARKRVLLLDAYGPGNSRASSGGESRIIRMGYGSEAIYTNWSKRSLELWKDLFSRTGQPLFHQTGMLWMAHDNDEWLKQTISVLKSAGVKHEVFGPRELRRRFPVFSPRGIHAAIREPVSGAIMARRAVQLVVKSAVASGVEYCQDSVVSLTGEQQITFVGTASGAKIVAGHFVFACGAWLPNLFPFLRRYIFPTRQEVFFFSARAIDDFQQMPCWYECDSETYGIPDLDNRGAKVAFDALGPAFDPEHGSRLVTAQAVRKMRRFLQKRIPVLANAALTETRVCQYESTPRRDFLIDRHPQFENCWIAGGGSGHGFKHGPAVGEYLTEIIVKNGRAEPRFSFDCHSSEKNK
jgi:monomeric sarcosine oxidase